MAYNSKYTGQQVDDLLDKAAATDTAVQDLGLVVDAQGRLCIQYEQTT